MKRLTALLLLFAIILSLAACAPEQSQDDTPDAGQEEDAVPTPSREPMPDPAESYTVTASDAADIYDKTGVYFFDGVDAVEDVSYSLIGLEELEEPIGEMRFTAEGLTVTYRIHSEAMINADQAGLLFGTKELAARESVRISNNITTLDYDEGGEAILYWHDTDAGLNCCVHFSSSENMESVVLYANLLYAFIHSDTTPEPETGEE